MCQIYKVLCLFDDVDFGDGRNSNNLSLDNITRGKCSEELIKCHRETA